MSSPDYFVLAAHRAFAMSASEEKADMTIRSKILSAFVIVCGLLTALIRQPVPQRVIEFVQAPPLHSRTIVRSGFVAFNTLAHVFSTHYDSETPTQRAFPDG